MATCECGCGALAPIATRDDPRRGYVKGLPRRFVNYHHKARPAIRYTVEDRGYMSPCWIWAGSITREGYGRSYLNYVHHPAHRAVYESQRGPVPEGLTLDHLCRNRSCVNPDHLEPVTMRENTLRGDTLPARYASRTHCSQGHAYTAENTAIRSDGGRYCRTCRNAQSRARQAQRSASQRARRATAALAKWEARK